MFWVEDSNDANWHCFFFAKKPKGVRLRRAAKLCRCRIYAFSQLSITPTPLLKLLSSRYAGNLLFRGNQSTFTYSMHLHKSNLCCSRLDISCAQTAFVSAHVRSRTIPSRIILHSFGCSFIFIAFQSSTLSQPHTHNIYDRQRPQTFDMISFFGRIFLYQLKYTLTTASSIYQMEMK